MVDTILILVQNIMKVETGKAAVWQHAKETGLADGIAMIAKVFDHDIKDVCIIGSGKMSYIHDRPNKLNRIPAIPIEIDKTAEIARVKAAKNRLK